MANEAIKLDGGKQLRHAFEELPKRVRNKGLRQAVSASASPVVKELKANTEKESGLLRKSETKKIKTYDGGKRVVAIIGSKREVTGEYKGKKRVPANYFHLVEDGVAPHSTATGSSIRHEREGKAGTGGMHPGFEGRHALQHAYDAKKDDAGEIMLDKLQDVLEDEAGKLARGS